MRLKKSVPVVLSLLSLLMAGQTVWAGKKRDHTKRRGGSQAGEVVHHQPHKEAPVRSHKTGTPVSQPQTQSPGSAVSSSTPLPATPSSNTGTQQTSAGTPAQQPVQQQSTESQTEKDIWSEFPS